MKRVYLEGPLGPGSRVVASTARAHYLGRVLRMAPGEALRVFDGRGAEFDATIHQVSRHQVLLNIGAAVAAVPESPLRVTLALGVSRGERMDTAIQKAVELGVARIAPVFTSRSTVRLEGARADHRREHWREVVVSACEQCGRSLVPAVEPPRSLGAWLEAAEPGLKLCLAPDGGRQVRDLSWTGQPVTLLVGPEGGLAPAELAATIAAGYQRLVLGPRVLRTETAPLAALAVLQARWGDLGG